MSIPDHAGANGCHVGGVYQEVLVGLVVGGVGECVFPVFKVGEVLVEFLCSVLSVNVTSTSAGLSRRYSLEDICLSMYQ